MSTIIVIRRVPVKLVEERFKSMWVSGTGERAKFTKQSQGWYMLLQGSWEALYVGMEKPDVVRGDLGGED